MLMESFPQLLNYGVEFGRIGSGDGLGYQRFNAVLETTSLWHVKSEHDGSGGFYRDEYQVLSVFASHERGEHLLVKIEGIFRRISFLEVSAVSTRRIAWPAKIPIRSWLTI
jgi:hypothetical protein